MQRAALARQPSQQRQFDRKQLANVTQVKNGLGDRCHQAQNEDIAVEECAGDMSDSESVEDSIILGEE